MTEILPTGSRPSQVSTPKESSEGVAAPSSGGGSWGRRLAAAGALLGIGVLVRWLRQPNGTGDETAANEPTTVDDATGRRTQTEEPSDSDDSHGRFVRLAAAAVAASAVGYLARRLRE